jgi:ring-1,2-phenylacetyl-CoA epoxidase subunit PaaD
MVRKTTDQHDPQVASDEASRSPRIQSAWNALDAVADPEIPTVSIVELGMIADVRDEGGRIVVDMTPTFSGCPALDLIKSEIKEALAGANFADVAVNIVYDPPWTTDRITEVGRKKLKEFGLAPPGNRCDGGMPNLDQTPCPFCDSTNTELESIFGPTLCRSIHYCHACLQSFEHFKAV